MTKEEYLNRYFEARHMGLRAVASDAWDAALSAGAPMNDEQLGQLYHTARNAASFRDFKTVAVEILADGGKGEAVAWMTDDGRVATDETKTTTMHGSTAKSFHIPLYAAPQVECAPRGAQPVTEILRLLSKMHDECGTNAGQDALWDAHEAIKQLFAAPTPERADAEKDAVLIRVMASLAAAISLLERGSKRAAPSDKMFDQMLADYRKSLDDARAILAANKEPERAQESAAVQDAIEDVAKYFEDCGDPYGAKMIRKYAFNKFAANKAELTKEGE